MIRTAFLFAALLVAAPAGAQSVQAGIEAWNRQDHAGAVAIWRPLAARGDADAAFNLGQAYKLGRGVPTSLVEAQSWYERAARAGHLDAQTSLGLLLFQNGNRIAALRWLKSAADRGEPRAMLVYGTALFNGDGVDRDLVRAYALVSRSAAQGYAPARETLAEMDELIPLPDRQRGVALAQQLASSGASASTSPVRPAPAPVAPARPPAPATRAPAVVAAKPAPPAARPAATGRWRIQLGAFGQRGSAEALFRRLSGSAPVSGRSAFYVPAGAVTRLQVGPFATQAEAKSACGVLATRGQPCFPVAAP